MKSAEQMSELPTIQRSFLLLHEGNGVGHNVRDSWIFVSGLSYFDKIIHVFSFLLGKSFNLVLFFLKGFLKLLGSCLLLCFLGFSSFDSIGNNRVFQVYKP
jgi:hypothetical protein|tara:strand:- start:220 stop:522 length:303 start_codon:yes stop_codon:yes gene_type:complete